MKILIFLGTVRQGRYSEPVAKLVEKVTKERQDVEVSLVDPRSYDLKWNDEGQALKKTYPELTKIVTEADAYIIVAPEYNHGYPGSLKHLLDMHLKEYIHKPVAYVGVSAGPFGGTRVIEQLVQITREMGMMPTFSDVNVSHAHQEIQEGKFVDQDKWTKRINSMLDELIWVATLMSWGRENLEQANG